MLAATRVTLPPETATSITASMLLRGSMTRPPLIRRSGGGWAGAWARRSERRPARAARERRRFARRVAVGSRESPSLEVHDVLASGFSRKAAAVANLWTASRSLPAEAGSHRSLILQQHQAETRRCIWRVSPRLPWPTRAAESRHAGEKHASADAQAPAARTRSRRSCLRTDSRTAGWPGASYCTSENVPRTRSCIGSGCAA